MQKHPSKILKTNCMYIFTKKPSLIIISMYM